MFQDMAGDGLQHQTAWAGAGNAVLFYDATGVGALTRKDKANDNGKPALSVRDLAIKRLKKTRSQCTNVGRKRPSSGLLGRSQTT